MCDAFTARRQALATCWPMAATSDATTSFVRVHRWCAFRLTHRPCHLITLLLIMPCRAVSRSRFLDHVPQAIESVDVAPGGKQLAVLRANADIEVWDIRQGETHCSLRIAGTVDTPVRRVAWGARTPRHPEGRLFSCGLHGLVTEWDLRSLSPRASWDSCGGAAWTMDIHVASRTMAVGCEDGGCSIFDLRDDEAVEPTLVHRTPLQGGRLLGVAFSPQGSHLACSAADGSVRVWHVPS